MKLQLHSLIFNLIIIAILPFILYYVDLEWSKGPKGYLRNVTFKPLFSEKANACFLVLCRNSDLNDIKNTVSNLEDKFNKKYNYPYVFLNDSEFTNEFKLEIRKITQAQIEFGLIPSAHWEIPPHIDKEALPRIMERMKREGVLYGDKMSYHLMCQYFSMYFYKHPLTLKYEYYWRVEPDVQFLCEIKYDPFVWMQQNGKLYGWVISLIELRETIPTLWETTLYFMRNNQELIDKNNHLSFHTKLGGKYSKCHFWSNFEIASFSLFRSEKYEKYVELLNTVGGFFYERWGDAPVHSLAVGMFLHVDQVHFFEDIGYNHPPSTHCPAESWGNNCICSENDSFWYASGSCSSKWIKIKQKELFPINK